MNHPWQDSVNGRIGGLSLNGATFLYSSGHTSESPIDEFYNRVSNIVTFGSAPVLASNQFLGPLLVVGLVSAVESYFRLIFGACIDVCSICQKHSVDQKISLGSAIWHQEKIGRGALEHLSLADKKTIINQSEKFLGFKISGGSDTFASLTEFDKICELRHGIVHNSGNLPGTNAINLGFSVGAGPHRIVVDYARLQEVALICRSLVAAYNIELFSLMAERWALSWIPRKNHGRFKKLWSIFFSNIDFDAGNLTHPLSLIKCRNSVMGSFT
jgi:hypothetical protein